MANAAVLAGICIGTGFGVGVGVALAVFFLFYCGCWTCPDEEEEEDELEFRGIPLNSRVPDLSEEQRQVRDKALGRYRRHMEREDIRQQRRDARARREQLRAEGVEVEDAASREVDRYDTSSIASTATSRLNSTVVYGHGDYVHPPSIFGDTRTNSVAGTRRNSLCESVGGHSTSSRASRGTLASIRSFFRHNNRRTKAKRRHRREDPDRAMEVFQQWATGSSSSLSSSSISAPPRVGQARGHDDEPRSIASSLPRPPEEVMADMHFGSGVPQLVLPSSMPLHTTDSMSEPANHQPFLLRPERSVGSTRRSGVSSNDAAHRRSGVAVVDMEPLHDDGGRGSPDSTPLPPAMFTARPNATPVPTTTATTTTTAVEEDWRKKKWTGRDVENNVALSGFFATTQSLPLAPSLSPPRSPPMHPSNSPTSQPQ